MDHGSIIVLVILVNTGDNVKGNLGFGKADFESSWLAIESNAPGKARVDVSHNLGEIPILVDVQVKSVSSPNKNFIFPGLGGCPRDDDQPIPYGGVIYLYNDKQVMVSSPIHSNDLGTGFALYTDGGEYSTGVNRQSSDTVQIKVRAWRQSSMPPDFHKTNIPVRTGSPKAYIEEHHGFGDYPSLVKVRTKLKDGKLAGWVSDAVGSSIVAYPARLNTQSRYVVYGFNDRTVRVWISGHADSWIFAGDDGYEIGTRSSSGFLEIIAWNQQTLTPWSTHTSRIGPGVSGELLEQTIDDHGLTSDQLYMAVWAESDTGVNAGYRFPGSGALAYDTAVYDATCTYGGLMYGYTESTLRFWRPTNASNGGLICIASYFGNGVNTQRDLDAKIVAHMYAAYDTSNFKISVWEPVEQKCVHTVKAKSGK